MSKRKGLEATACCPRERRASKYLNNLVEQDHRNIRSRINVVFGFRRLWSAAINISRIELVHRVRKGPLDLSVLELNDNATPSV